MLQPATRRVLLRGAAGAVAAAALSGCRAAQDALTGSAPHSSAARSSSAAQASSSAIELRVVGYGPGALPHVSETFAKAHPDIRLVSISVTPPPQKTHWVAMLAGQGAPGVQFVPLDSALRALNFDPTVLIPGSTDPYIHKGQTAALPFTAIPWGVQWRSDAFAAAGLPPPSPGWTWDDFRNACSALSSLAASGRLKGLQGALAPMVMDAPPNAKEIFPGALNYPGLWQAFAWGFGGSVVANGKFRLTDPATMEGITHLVELGRQFAVTQAEALAGGFALAFDLYYPGRLQPGWQWARLPRFPHTPVIPTVSVAQGVAYGLQTPAPSPDAPDVRAAAEYLMWWYTPDAISLLDAEATPPAVAKPGVQAAYWQGKGSAAAAVGDWPNFLDCYSGFPWVADLVMYDALDQVLAGKVDLQSAMATAEQEMNNQSYLQTHRSGWYSLPRITAAG